MLLNCSEFQKTSSDETRLFWKSREGWRYIDTTAFGLGSSGTDLNDYVSQYAVFYLNSTARSGYISQVLEAVKGHYDASSVRHYDVSELTEPGCDHAIGNGTVYRNTTVDERLGDFGGRQT